MWSLEGKAGAVRGGRQREEGVQAVGFGKHSVVVVVGACVRKPYPWVARLRG